MTPLESAGKIKDADHLAWPKTLEQELAEKVWTQEKILLPERVGWNEAVDALIDGWYEKDPPRPVPRHPDQERIVLKSNGDKVAEIVRYQFRNFDGCQHPPGEARKVIVVGKTPHDRLINLGTILENLKNHGANV